MNSSPKEFEDSVDRLARALYPSSGTFVYPVYGKNDDDEKIISDHVVDNGDVQEVDEA